MTTKQCVQRPTGLMELLFKAQGGKCFHCGQPMLVPAIAAALKKRSEVYTREHVYPRRGSGRGMAHNYVLAHPPCNSQKGFREPTPDEVERARALYEAIGLEFFIPSSAATPQVVSRYARKFARKGRAAPTFAPTLRDVWPQ